MAQVALKYLFTCEFEDGSTLAQSSEDVSAIDTKRSAFYDVLEKDKVTAIVRFWLKGDGKELLVDLQDGHFELNGISFNCHENLPDPSPELRLIFYRQHTHQFNMEREELSHEIEYCIGWQTTIGGKNYKETITIK